MFTQRLFLLIACIYNIQAGETKNWGQLGWGAAFTAVGLVGAGCAVKYIKEWLGELAEERALEKNIEDKGAKVVNWSQYLGDTVINHTELEFSKEKKYAQQDIEEIEKSWDKLTDVKSAQHHTAYLFGWSVAFGSLLVVGPSIIYKEVFPNK